MSQENPVKRTMDMTNAAQGIWMVKMPNYVARLWDKSPSDMQVATLRMEHSADNKVPAKVKLVLSQQLLQLDPQKLYATEHELKLSKATPNAQTTGIFSTTECDTESAMEGVIKYKMECLPVCNTQYLHMKKQASRNARNRHGAEAIGSIVSNFKPVSNHVENREDAKRKKEAASKVVSRESVMNMLFQAFEKHQYYTLKDLQFITKQSYCVLKAILKEIADYSKSSSHKKMWELKPEYCHYDRKKPEEVKK